MRSLLLLLCLAWTLSSCSFSPRKKTVFVAILARNQAHFLPRYLKTIENLDYDKKLITVYVNTNNNDDDTEEILREWVKENKKNYRSIILESYEATSLEAKSLQASSPEKLRAIGSIRNRSLKLARKHQCDFYFVSDCDNFVTPHTLKTLISKKKPIIAPMLIDLLSPEEKNAQFYLSVNDSGNSSFDRFYCYIYDGKLRGLVQVPLVHGTYLIKGEYLDRLSYVDNTYDHEFVVFSRIARANRVDQFICNEKDFGVQFAFINKQMPPEQKIVITRPFLSLP